MWEPQQLAPTKNWSRKNMNKLRKFWLRRKLSPMMRTKRRSILPSNIWRKKIKLQMINLSLKNRSILSVIWVAFIRRSQGLKTACLFFSVTAPTAKEFPGNSSKKIPPKFTITSKRPSSTKKYTTFLRIGINKKDELYLQGEIIDSWWWKCSCKLSKSSPILQPCGRSLPAPQSPRNCSGFCAWLRPLWLIIVNSLIAISSGV